MSLTLRNIYHEYRTDAPVLVDVSLQVDLGEVVAVMGPSGSGKTTLLTIAGLLLQPTAGEVSIAGSAHASTSKMRSTLVSWILQTTNALPRRSLRDNVALAGLARGWSRQRALGRADQMLEDVGLGRHGSAQARVLSGGELQRLAVARGLVGSPVVLLADEPTANLDRTLADSVVDSLLRASTETAVLIATHDPKVAERADRVFQLESGRLAGG